MDLTDHKLTRREYAMVSSMLFALFFGAGNLIFPLHLGQLAGAHWLSATAGFLVTAVLLPLLSVLAISMTRAEGVYDIGRPLGAWFALTFMVLIHGTIGPFFGTPRTATVSYTVGIAPLVPTHFQTLGLLLFSAAFFGLAYFFSIEQNKIVANLGKLLNPVFLVLLSLIFLLAFLKPLGQPTKQAVTTAYVHDAFFNGFLQGYNTMDALAGLAFGVTVVAAIRSLGKRKPNDIAVVTARAGLFSMSFEGVIYLLLIVIGAMSLGQFKVAANGGVTFDQLVNHYLGIAGQGILAALITITCLTTAIGLVAAFAQDFHKHFPAISYLTWLKVTTLASFLTANVGLNLIISWSTPFLMFLYPLSMVLILLSITSPLFHRDAVVYGFVVAFTVVPAFFDMITAFPPVVSQSAFGKAMTAFQQAHFPLAQFGMGWLVPATIGALIGLAIHLLRRRQSLNDSVSSTSEN